MPSYRRMALAVRFMASGSLGMKGARAQECELQQCLLRQDRKSKTILGLTKSPCQPGLHDS